MTLLVERIGQLSGSNGICAMTRLVEHTTAMLEVLRCHPSYTLSICLSSCNWCFQTCCMHCCVLDHLVDQVIIIIIIIIIIILILAVFIMLIGFLVHLIFRCSGCG